MLPWVCSVIDHRRRQNVVRTSVTHSAIASCATFLILPHFDVICDLLLNRRTATWNLFVKYIYNMYTMCPPGCHHNGFMATPELGHRIDIYSVIYISKKKTNKLQVHPYKPVSWSPTHPLMSGRPRNRLVGMNLSFICLFLRYILRSTSMY